MKNYWRYKLLGWIREIEWRVQRFAERFDVCYVCGEEADEWCEGCQMRVCYPDSITCEDCTLCRSCAEVTEEFLEKWEAAKDEL